MAITNTPSTPPVLTKEVIRPDSVEGNVRQETSEREQYAALFSTLLESNALLLDEIRALKQQQSALSANHCDISTDDRFSQSLPLELCEDEIPLVNLSTQSSSHISRSVSTLQDDGESPWGEEVVDIESTTLEEPASECSASFADSSAEFPKADPFASPGTLALHSMWDNFSVDDYWFPDSSEIKDSSKGNKETWTPKITVPEPFSMTIREAQTPKQKSRSLKMAEEEMLRKSAMEEAELKKKFRASPIPASTFLPLYELVNAKNEQRKEEITRLSKEFLKANERPFSFTQREKEINKAKVKQAALMKQIEEKERRKNVFKARPVPKNLFSPDIGERINEQEEYRQMKIQIRSKELLANAKLPGSMELRYQAKHERRRLLEQRKRHDRLFHPNINGIVPDYDQAYCEFQKKLAAKRRTKQTTITEPFFLHTEQKAVRKQQAVAPHTKVSLRSPKHSCSKPIQSIYPAQMTQAALLRQSLTQDRLMRKVQEPEQNTERLYRSRVMKKTIVEKSNASGILKQKPTQKKREFQ